MFHEDSKAKKKSSFKCRMNDSQQKFQKSLRDYSPPSNKKIQNNKNQVEKSFQQSREKSLKISRRKQEQQISKKRSKSQIYNQKEIRKFKSEPNYNLFNKNEAKKLQNQISNLNQERNQSQNYKKKKQLQINQEVKNYSTSKEQFKRLEEFEIKTNQEEHQIEDIEGKQNDKLKQSISKIENVDLDSSSWSLEMNFTGKKKQNMQEKIQQSQQVSCSKLQEQKQKMKQDLSFIIENPAEIITESPLIIEEPYSNKNLQIDDFLNKLPQTPNISSQSLSEFQPKTEKVPSISKTSNLMDEIQDENLIDLDNNQISDQLINHQYSNILNYDFRSVELQGQSNEKPKQNQLLNSSNDHQGYYDLHNNFQFKFGIKICENSSNFKKQSDGELQDPPNSEYKSFEISQEQCQNNQDQNQQKSKNVYDDKENNQSNNKLQWNINFQKEECLIPSLEQYAGNQQSNFNENSNNQNQLTKESEQEVKQEPLEILNILVNENLCQERIQSSQKQNNNQILEQKSNNNSIQNSITKSAQPKDLIINSILKSPTQTPLKSKNEMTPYANLSDFRMSQISYSNNKCYPLLQGTQDVNLSCFQDVSSRINISQKKLATKENKLSFNINVKTEDIPENLTKKNTSQYEELSEQDIKNPEILSKKEILNNSEEYPNGSDNQDIFSDIFSQIQLEPRKYKSLCWKPPNKSDLKIKEERLVKTEQVRQRKSIVEVLQNESFPPKYPGEQLGLSVDFTVKQASNQVKKILNVDHVIEKVKASSRNRKSRYEYQNKDEITNQQLESSVYFGDDNEDQLDFSRLKPQAEKVARLIQDGQIKKVSWPLIRKSMKKQIDRAVLVFKGLQKEKITIEEFQIEEIIDPNVNSQNLHQIVKLSQKCIDQIQTKNSLALLQITVCDKVFIDLVRKDYSVYEKLIGEEDFIYIPG